MAKRIPIDHRTDIYLARDHALRALALAGRRSRGRTPGHAQPDTIFRDPSPSGGRIPGSEGPRDDRAEVPEEGSADRYGHAEALPRTCGASCVAIRSRRVRNGWERFARRAWNHRGRLAAIAVTLLLIATSGL